MWVYVVSVVWQRDSGECGSNVRVFQDVEKAFEQMKIEMESARTDFSDLSTEESDYADGDMSWSIWEEGEYCYNHIDVTITECYVY